MMITNIIGDKIVRRVAQLFYEVQKARQLKNRALFAVFKFKMFWKSRMRKFGGTMDQILANRARAVFMFYTLVMLSPYKQKVLQDANPT